MSKSFQHISVVAVATLVSRFLGLGRDMLVTAVFGVGPLASAFYTAFTLPNLFRRLLGEGALTAAFVPTLAEELRARERAGAFALVNTVASWLLAVTGAIVAVAMLGLWLFARSDVARAAPAGGSLERWVQAAELAVLLFPYLFLVCLAAIFSAALQTLQRFLEPALSPIWLNVSMIGLLAGAAYGGWAGDPRSIMVWLCAGALLGGTLQMVVPAVTLHRAGWRPRFDFRLTEPLRQILRLMAPTLFGSAIYLINMAVSKLIGLSLNDSAVAVLNLATRLMELPIGVFAIAVATVVFPLLSRQAAEGDWTSFAESYRKGLRLILVINVPAAFGLIVLAAPIIRVLFQRGEFGRAETLLMSPVLAVCALGLPFVSFTSLVLRAYYARKDTVTPVRAAALSFVINLVASLALMRPLGTVGLAAASTLATVVQAVYLQVQLTRRQRELGFVPLVPDVAKVLFASVLMGAFVALGWSAWEQQMPGRKAVDLVGLLAAVATGALLYGLLVWWLRIEGRQDLRAVLVRGLERVRRSPPT